MLRREPQPIVLPESKADLKSYRSEIFFSTVVTSRSAPVRVRRSWSCENCGQSVELFDCFCGYCGTKIQK